MPQELIPNEACFALPCLNSSFDASAMHVILLVQHCFASYRPCFTSVSADSELSTWLPPDNTKEDLSGSTSSVMGLQRTS